MQIQGFQFFRGGKQDWEKNKTFQTQNQKVTTNQVRDQRRNLQNEYSRECTTPLYSSEATLQQFLCPQS